MSSVRKIVRLDHGFSDETLSRPFLSRFLSPVLEAFIYRDQVLG